jgi:MerR family transcriptional regulator, thiopeptide resistance regulator
MDKTYRVTEFAGLTKVTVRALHYYDQIGLLAPSGRTPSRYRVYTDKDLFRLQQIVTLKFLGLSLDQIKKALSRPQSTVVRSMRLQAEAVEKEIERLKRAARALRETSQMVEAGGPLDWKKLINVMEEIQMTEDIKKTWAKHYTEAEMKEFEEIGKKYTPEMMEAYQKKWTGLIDEVKANLHTDPAGPAAQSLAKRWKALLEEGYGGHPGLQKKISAAYQSEWKAGNTGGSAMPFGPEIWEFIHKAMEVSKTTCK